MHAWNGHGGLNVQVDGKTYRARVSDPPFGTVPNATEVHCPHALFLYLVDWMEARFLCGRIKPAQIAVMVGFIPDLLPPEPRRLRMNQNVWEAQAQDVARNAADIAEAVASTEIGLSGRLAAHADAQRALAQRQNVTLSSDDLTLLNAILVAVLCTP